MIDILTTYGINNDFWNFIEQHKDENTTKLLLSKKYQNTNFDLKFAALQIECRKRISKKWPDIANLQHFLFPALLPTEQCTHQLIAQFHASLFAGCETVLDLTAGLGVDDFYISDKITHLISVEINPLIAATLQYNMNRYRNNVTVINDNAINYLDYLITNNNQLDAVYVDPARRDTHGNRVYGLSDCEPNVLQLLKKIENITNTLYIKTSPMIDISQVINNVPQITDIWVMGINNECKELLLRTDLSQKQMANESVIIHTHNYENSGALQSLTLSYPHNLAQEDIIYGDNILTYLYEPNCCIMKASAFSELFNRYEKLIKLGKKTHLYTSNELYSDFPGRIFQVTETIPYKDKYLKHLNRKYPKANISTRNFKLTAQEIRNKFKIKDGDDTNLFATTISENKQILIVANRILKC